MKEEGSNSKLKEKLYYLNNIMAEWRNLEKKDLCSPKTLHLANDLQERLKKIKKDLLQDSAEKHSVSGVTHATVHPEEIYRWSYRSVDPDKIYGVEDEALIVERLLVKEGFKAIGLVGMAGVGKTALCQKVFNTEQVKKRFHPRIWVCVSKQPNVDNHKKELVMMMLMCLGFEKKIVDKVGEGPGGLNRLILALRRQLNRQRYLIVLDDVWNMDDIGNIDEDFNKFCSELAQDDKKEDRLAYGLPKGHDRAVIVTSRSPAAMENMVGKKNFHSVPLADNKSCWKIFEDANKDGGALIEDILKNEIVKECAGLPLIAKMLGKIGISQANGPKTSHQTQAQEETHQQEA